METTEIGPKLGPTGQRTMRNLKELRGRTPVRELSQRLAEIGRPILPSGITKIEQGTRRVDVDDLVALAIALGVSPNRLLLDPESDVEALPLTEGVAMARSEAWDWASGAAPYEPDKSFLDLERLGNFRRENRPNEPDPIGTPLSELLELGQTTLAPIAAAAEKAMESGVSFDQVVEYLQMWHTMKGTLQAMLDNHPDNPDNRKAGRKPRKSTPRKAG